MLTNKTHLTPGLPGLATNHNQTMVGVRPLPIRIANHNQTVRPTPTVWPQHNQTIVRSPWGTTYQHNQTLVRR